MNGRDGPRTVSLAQQLTMESDFDSPNIRTLPTRTGPGGAWNNNNLRTASGRTLFDIIQQDDTWKPVKDRLRIQRVGAAFSGGPNPNDVTPTSHQPAEAPPSSLTNGAGGPRTAFGGNPALKRNSTLARTMTRSTSVQPSLVSSFRRAPGVEEIVITDITDVTDENEHEDDKDEEQAKEDSPGGGMSLMALLEQTDTQWGDDGPEESDELNFKGDDGGEFDDDEEADGEGLYHVCCVCMVRHKGAAFVPCGHTFCRLCSRELWVSRGNCPLCNGFIQEILDIF